MEPRQIPRGPFHCNPLAQHVNPQRQNLTVKVRRVSNRSIDFDLVGVDASIANAFRRIIIAEVPTICIENVYVYNNTSVVVDEILAQRIGLVPLNVDPKTMDMRVAEDESTDRNTLVFDLKLECTRKKDAPKDATDPDLLYDNHELRSGHLAWQPAGEQAEVFSKNPPAPTNPNIVLAKLRPGQGVEITLHAVKGVGKDHAKFSPVGACISRTTTPTDAARSDRVLPPPPAHRHQKAHPAPPRGQVPKVLRPRRHPRRPAHKGRLRRRGQHPQGHRQPRGPPLARV
jgi:DNA-directed RNA polymerase I and III subunit RPAC1